MSVDAWQPLWIGDAPRQLYAALHAAAAARVGVLMAPPLLHEQPRSRRVLVEVASRLAALGLACLRFDYFGTGDSAGDGEQHDIGAMHADLDVAAAALRSGTGVQRIVVLAWRGAALPVASWAARRADLGAFAMWEPVVGGAAWLAQLETADRAQRMERYGMLQDDPCDTHLMGFPTSAAWRSGIAAARVDASATLPLWALARAGAAPAAAQRHFELPADAPRFDDGVGIEDAMFLSRKLFGVVDDFARACAALDA